MTSFFMIGNPRFMNMQISKFECEYRAVRREELTALFRAKAVEGYIGKCQRRQAFINRLLWQENDKFEFVEISLNRNLQ